MTCAKLENRNIVCVCGQSNKEVHFSNHLIYLISQRYGQIVSACRMRRGIAIGSDMHQWRSSICIELAIAVVCLCAVLCGPVQIKLFHPPYSHINLCCSIKNGKVVIVLQGRYAGRKAVVIRTYEEVRVRCCPPWLTLLAAVGLRCRPMP
jgi:hypothetical protein